MIRLLTILLLVGAIAGCGRSHAPRARAQDYGTNRLGQVEAVALASRLSAGMKEEAADTMLYEHGLSGQIGLGCSHGWNRYYTLTNGSSLVLEIRPHRANPRGAWTDGRLRTAVIRSNLVNIVSIKLKNAP
jgi:hypothetical protein